MFFLLCIFVKIICIIISHSIGVMVNTTFPVMDEVIWVRAIPEFEHQVCIKLIGSSGPHKHSCALKPVFILNTGSITTTLSTFPNSSPLSASWCDQLNEGVQKLTRKKPFLWKNFLCGNVSEYYTGHLFYFRFMEAY